jgi:ABC-type lipoprotein export system ATPase subunit
MANHRFLMAKQLKRMKQLESFTIEQFRGLKRLQLEGLSRVNLLFGLNNSGKTTVLEALSCYARPLDGLHWLSVALGRFGTFSRGSRVQALKWLFPQQSDSSPNRLYEGGKVAFSAQGKCPVARSEASLKEIVGYLSSGSNAASPDLQGLADEEPEDAAHRRGAQLHMEIQKKNGDSERRQLTVWDGRGVVRRETKPERSFPMRFISLNDFRSNTRSADHFSEVRQLGLYNEAIEVLRRLDSGVREILVLSGSRGLPVLHIEHSRTGLTPLSVCGGGMQRAVYIAFTVPVVRGGVLLVDEIESALHVSVLAQVFELLATACEDHDVQLFATTHSLEALDAMLKSDAVRRDGIVAFRLPQAGAQEKPVRFSGEMLHRLRYERGLDVRT